MSITAKPKHYASTRGGLEAIDVIEAFPHIQGNFRLANSAKYLLRAGRKDDYRQDLLKALQYLHREIYGTWFTEPETRE